MIVIDQREPQVLIDLVHQATRGDTRTDLLITADFIIRDQDGCQMGVERKTISDFLGSFQSGRLAAQLNRLRRDFVPVLLVEGGYTLTDNMRLKIGRHNTNWHHAAFQMALFSFMRDGVIVMRTFDHRGTADVLRMLNHRAVKGCVKHGSTPILDVWPTDEEETLRKKRPVTSVGVPSVVIGHEFSSSARSRNGSARKRV
jgi:ERCC4-type nuclease